MAGYVSSWIENYTGSSVVTCATPVEETPVSNYCLLYVIAGVVFLSLAFEKKRKVPTK